MNDLSHPLGKQAPRQIADADGPGARERISPVAGPATRRVQDAERHPRLARELQTIRAMVHLHCRDHHAPNGDQCRECTALFDYATRRLDRCVFGDEKPTCANCKVHCYNVTMRERVREVMRYAGPRMLWRHPVLTLMHMREGRRAAPELPAGVRHAPDAHQEGSDGPERAGREGASPSGFVAP